jgi:SOS-response transcriptional repressor LexA
MKPLTEREQAVIAAVNDGHTSVRAIAQAIGLKSYSNVARYCHRLEERGFIVMRRTRQGKAVATGRDFCMAWDAACRLAGNPEA